MQLTFQDELSCCLIILHKIIPKTSHKSGCVSFFSWSAPSAGTLHQGWCQRSNVITHLASEFAFPPPPPRAKNTSSLVAGGEATHVDRAACRYGINHRQCSYCKLMLESWCVIVTAHCAVGACEATHVVEEVCKYSFIYLQKVGDAIQLAVCSQSESKRLEPMNCFADLFHWFVLQLTINLHTDTC